MSDVKDILGVARGKGASGEAKPKKAAAPKMKRPTGLSREAFALLGDSHPIMSSQLLEGLKKNKESDQKMAKPKPSTKGIPTWSFKGFKNSARTDGLELKRWHKGYKDLNGRVRESEETEYYYAKFNKKVRRMACAWGCMGLCTSLSVLALDLAHPRGGRVRNNRIPV